MSVTSEGERLPVTPVILCGPPPQCTCPAVAWVCRCAAAPVLTPEQAQEVAAIVKDFQEGRQR